MDRSRSPLSMLTGALHELPLNVSSLPASSTAAQNVDDGHDTELISALASMRAGVLHELPLNVAALPCPPTVTHKVSEAQETEAGESMGSTGVGVDHDSAASALAVIAKTPKRISRQAALSRSHTCARSAGPCSR
jgi:hypothetical protein